MAMSPLRSYLVTLLLILVWIDPKFASARDPLKSIPVDRDISKLNFTHLNVFGNVAVGRIQVISQDHLGFMWIGTRQGLFRYDGLRIQGFEHVDGDSTTIANENILSILIDSRNRIWIGTTKGVSRYNRATDTFTNFLTGTEWDRPGHSNSVNSIVETDDGEIFFAVEEGTLFEYNEATKTFTKSSERNFGLVKSLAIDDQDRLWLGANNRVTVYDHSDGTAETFVGDLAGKDEVNLNLANSICYIAEDEVWIGTSFNGVVILNPLTGETRVLPMAIQREHYVNQLSLDSQDRVWAATNDSIVVYDRTGSVIIRYNSKNETAKGLPHSGVTTLWSDSQGNLWAGSNYDGISVSTATQPFSIFPLSEDAPDLTPNSPVSVFLQDKRGRRWIGSPYSGVYMYPNDGGDPVFFEANPEDPNSISEQPVLTAFEDSRGDIWIGTYRGGLFRFREETQDFESYLYHAKDPHSIGGQDIRDISEDEDGNLWIGMHATGLSMFDVDTKKFHNYRIGTNDTSNGIELLGNWVNAVTVDSQNRLWIGSSIGLTKVNPERTTSSKYVADVDEPHSISDSEINQVYEDSNGRIWIATNNGLNLYRPNSDDFIAFKKSAGFPHSHITSVVEDDSGSIWTGTLDGLAKFDPETLSVRTFRQSDGLASNDFFERQAERTPDGTLFFGQSRGLTYFHPNEINKRGRVPNVFITGILSYSTPLPVVPGSSEIGVLGKSVIETRSIDLKYDQNALTFEFIALDFAKSDEVEYAYKLENLDTNWVFTSGLPAATYTNLTPGNYTFRVKASNGEGNWNEVGDSLAIAIMPPVWGTLWFRALFLLTVVAIPTFFIRWRLKLAREHSQRLELAVSERTSDLLGANNRLEEANAKIRTHGEILEETVRQRTRELEIAKIKAERSDRLKSAFLANMSHEIRTPMNAIIGFLHILENENLKPEEREQFHGIIRLSSQSLMALIDDILDLSTIEAGEAEINPTPCNLEEICQELAAMFRESLSAEKGDNVHFELERDICSSLPKETATYLLVDPIRLKQILWNLISNAIKFTDLGSIVLKYRIYGSQENVSPYRIHFSVADSGIGIPPEEQDQVFNRFHKLDRHGKKTYRGTGLGLTITKTLTELMGGTISVESKLGIGTTFHVDFPYRSVTIAPPDLGTTKKSHQEISSDFKGIKILVVEDETPNYDYIENVLKPTEAEISWAENGVDALSLYESEKPDLILLDLMIPEIDGYEVARRIRLRDQQTPIVAQSAYAMREDQSRSIAAGANEHLSKPFSPELLLETLCRYLKP